MKHDEVKCLKRIRVFRPDITVEIRGVRGVLAFVKVAIKIAFRPLKIIQTIDASKRSGKHVQVKSIFFLCVPKYHVRAMRDE